MSVKKMLFEKLEREQNDVVRLSLKVKYLCMTSVCKYHYPLNGEILSYDEVRAIYHPDSVEDDCNCGASQIMVGDDGEPLYPKVVERVLARKSRFE